MLKKSYFIIMITILISACNAQENTTNQKIYPPYPEVWGYDLSDYPALRCDVGSVHAYRMEDGDIGFLIDHSYKIENPMIEGMDRKYSNEKYILLKFFSGTKQQLNKQEAGKLLNALGDKEISPYEIVSFKDGSSLKYEYEPGARLCFTPSFISSYLVKKDNKGQEKKYSILGASPQVEVFTDRALCDFKGAPFIYTKLFPIDTLIDLKDDTFIAFVNGTNLILRFDKNFNTKFKPINPVATMHGNMINRNFFVIEYALIEELQEKWISEEVPLYQTIHNELLLYFKNKYPITHDYGK